MATAVDLHIWMVLSIGLLNTCTLMLNREKASSTSTFFRFRGKGSTNNYLSLVHFSFLASDLFKKLHAAGVGFKLIGPILLHS